MIDEKMMKFAQIRNSYVMKKFGTLSNEERALHDYDGFCLELIEENQKYKEVIDKAIEYIKGAYELALYTKSVNLDEENIEELLDILKEVKQMNKEEIQVLLKTLKSSIPSEYIRSCDTGDGVGRYEEDEYSWQYELYTYINQLQQENQKLKEDISFCLKSIKQEMEMSTDSRTRGEMTSCYEILSRWNK